MKIIEGMSVAASCAGVLGLAVAAHADYIIDLKSNGSSIVTVQPGASFNLDVVLSGEPDTVHNSAIFQLEFSTPGLLYESYSWASPYVTGNIFDDSKPFTDDLPAVLTDDLLKGPGYPADVVNIELSNVVPVPGETFGSGVLVTLLLTVPEGWDGASLIEIIAVPDTFADGFDEVNVIAGTSMMIVIPAPPVSILMGGMLCMLGCGAARRRRR